MTSSELKLSTAWQTRAAAGEPTSIIQVKNLTSTITGPHDAWGRPARPQPISVSVELSLTQPFRGSSAGDVVDSDTVHYGLLSKQIQKLLEAKREGDPSLAGVLDGLWRGMLGWTLLDTGTSEDSPETAFLKASSVRYLRLTVHLPKASLLGSGVSLTASSALASGQIEARASTLEFHDLYVPSLIGVNSNERQAVQMIVANVDVDRWIETSDSYSSIAGVITEILRSSTYETLEALALFLCKSLNNYLLERFACPHEGGWRYTVSLEKPIAVPSADAPCVQLSLDSKEIKEIAE